MRTGAGVAFFKEWLWMTKGSKTIASSSWALAARPMKCFVNDDSRLVDVWHTS